MKDKAATLSGLPGSVDGNEVGRSALRTGQASRPALTLDVSLYEEYLADSDLTADQRREFLEALWTIVVSFVELGFGIHPVQQARDANGELDEVRGACESFPENSGSDRPDLLSLNNKRKTENPRPAGGDDRRRAERKET